MVTEQQQQQQQEAEKMVAVPQMLTSTIKTTPLKSTRHSTQSLSSHRTKFELFIAITILINGFDLLVKKSSQFEVAAAATVAANLQQQQHQYSHNQMQQRAALSEQVFRDSTSIATPVQYEQKQVNNKSGQIAPLQQYNRQLAASSVSTNQSQIINITANSYSNSNSNSGKILDYSQANHNQLEPIIAAVAAAANKQQQVASPSSSSSSSSSSSIRPRQKPNSNNLSMQQQQLTQPKQLLKPIAHNTLVPIAQQLQQQQQQPQAQVRQTSQASSAGFGNFEHIMPRASVPMEPTKAAATFNETASDKIGPTAIVQAPIQTTTTTGPEKLVASQAVKQDSCATGANRRGFKTVLRSAKNLLTGGFSSIEQRAGSILWFGSNVLATLVPIASLFGLVPSLAIAGNRDQLSAGDKLNNNTTGGGPSAALQINGKRANVAATLLASLANGASGSGMHGVGVGNGLQGRVEYVMGWLERSIEHLPSFPRLHPQECVKRSICEAHHDPTKYGAIGLTLRLLFPASNLSSTDEMDNMEYKVINKYKHAAGYGLNKRMDNNGTASGSVCKEKYEDCLISLLDVGQNLVSFFLKQD